MTDTQNLIANLMGSLKNTITRTPPTGQPIQTVTSMITTQPRPQGPPPKMHPKALQRPKAPKNQQPPLQQPPPVQNPNMPFYYQQQQVQNPPPNMQYGGYPNNPYPNQRPPFQQPMNNYYPNQNMYQQQPPPNMGQNMGNNYTYY